MSSRLILLIFLMFQFNGLKGQQTSLVKGVVHDSSNNPIEAAVIVVKTHAGDSIITMSDNVGSFQFSIEANNSFEIRVTMLGFIPYKNKFGSNSQEKIEIILTPQTRTLKEFTVRALPPPVVIKEDTVQFNIQRYEIKPNSVTEDLLKLLPGIFVDTDGSIIYMGRKITVLKINGREISVNQISDITKLLPAETIDHVQLIDDYGPLARAARRKAGSPTTILNLQTKSKQGSLTRLVAGKGTSGRYNTSLISNFIKDETVCVLGGGSNNTNADSKALTLSTANANYGTVLKDGLNFGTGIFSAINNSQGSSASITTSQTDSGELSFRDESQGQLQYKAITFRTTGEKNINAQPFINYSISGSLQNTITRNSNILEQSGFQSKKQYSDLMGTNHGSSINTSLFGSRNIEKLSSVISGQLAVANESTTSETVQADSILYYDKQKIFVGDSVIRRKINSHTNNVSIDALCSFVHWYDSLSSIETKYHVTLRNSNLTRKFYDTDSIFKERQIDSLNTANNMTNIQNTLDLNLKKQWAKSEFIVGGRFILNSLWTQNNSGGTSPKTYFNIVPVFRLQVNQGKAIKYVFEYSSEMELPTGDQLNPRGNYSISQNPVFGNPYLKPSINHSISVSFNNVNRPFSADASFSYYANKITATSRWISNAYNSLIQETHFTNVDGSYVFRLNYSYAHRTKNGKWLYSFNGTNSFENSVSYQDEQKVNTQSLQFTPVFKVAYSSKKFEIAYMIVYSKNITQFGTAPTSVISTGFVSPSFQSKLNLNRITISADLRKQFNNGVDKSLNTNPLSGNAQLEYMAFKNKMFLKVQCVNVFNARNTTNQTISPLSVTQSNQATAGRFFLFSLQLNISAFNKR